MKKLSTKEQYSSVEFKENRLLMNWEKSIQ